MRNFRGREEEGTRNARRNTIKGDNSVRTRRRERVCVEGFRDLIVFYVLSFRSTSSPRVKLQLLFMDLMPRAVLTLINLRPSNVRKNSVCIFNFHFDFTLSALSLCLLFRFLFRSGRFTAHFSLMLKITFGCIDFKLKISSNR